MSEEVPLLKKGDGVRLTGDFTAKLSPLARIPKKKGTLGVVLYNESPPRKPSQTNSQPQGPAWLQRPAVPHVWVSFPSDDWELWVPVRLLEKV